VEVALGLDPANPDTDGDGLSDGDEVTAGLDPADPDEDQDGVPDGEDAEIAVGGCGCRSAAPTPSAGLWLAAALIVARRRARGTMAAQ
jgi:MYXO-CTERM domain-containing protein